MKNIVTIKPLPVVAILIGILSITINIAYADLNGTGLNGGMFYKSLGVGTYVLFYGGMIVGFWMFGSMLFYKGSYLQHDEINLYFKGRNIGRLQDIQYFQKSSQFFIIGNLSFRIGGKVISLSSLLVHQNLLQVENELRRLHQRQN